MRLKPVSTGIAARPPAMRKPTWRWAFLALAVVLYCPWEAQAYIGPGAGFTIVSTFFVLFAALASAFVVLLTWPFRWALKLVFRPKRAGICKAQRVVIVGFDGQDPELTEKWMDAGLLPNFSRLRATGAFPLGESSAFDPGCVKTRKIETQRELHSSTRS